MVEGPQLDIICINLSSSYRTLKYHWRQNIWRILMFYYNILNVNTTNWRCFRKVLLQILIICAVLPQVAYSRSGPVPSDSDLSPPDSADCHSVYQFSPAAGGCPENRWHFCWSRAETWEASNEPFAHPTSTRKNDTKVLTPWSNIFIEKLIVAQLFSNSAAFY